MAVQGVPVISAPGIPADASRPLPVRDPALAGVANNGVRFMFDTAFPWCYPGGEPATRPAAGAPAAGAVVRDIAEQASGTVLLPGGAIGFAGNGFDHTASTGLDTGIQVPASALADLWAAFGGRSQRFLIPLYVKLPALADWNASATLLSIMGDKSYQAAASLLILAMSSGGQLQVRRQTAAGAYDTTAPFTLAPLDYGAVVQIGIWRNDAGQGFRIRSASGVALATPAVGADNTQDFSANTFVIGRNGSSFNGGAGAGAAVPAMKGLRDYRGWIENLARSGRDPVTVLDADWTRQQARGLFS